MPPINFRPITADMLDAKKDPSLGLLNDILRELVDGHNVDIGLHGPIPLLNHIDLGGNRIINVGAPVKPTDALSQSSADPIYGTAAQQSAMEAVGTKILQTTRRLNDGTQQHKVSSDLNVQGSIPPTVVGGMTYTATATTVTWAWTNLQLKYGDLSLVQIADGTQLISGLTNGVQYFFYPYYDTTLGVVVFVVAANGVGTPQMAFTPADAGATQLQNSDGRVPLSIGGIKATPAGGGSGGGGGSSCIWAGMVVESRTSGIISLKQVHYGDIIRARRGWTRVTGKRMGADRVFIRVQLSNGEEVRVTPSDPVALFSGKEKPAGDLCLADLMIGIVDSLHEVPLQITGLSPWSQAGETVLLSVDDPEHNFLFGLLNPCVVAHNFLPTK